MGLPPLELTWSGKIIGGAAMDRISIGGVVVLFDFDFDFQLSLSVAWACLFTFSSVTPPPLKYSVARVAAEVISAINVPAACA